MPKPLAVFSQNPTTVTLAGSQQWLTEAAQESPGAVCPCCHQRTRIYRRSVTAGQAAVLILLHRTFPVGALVHIQNFLVALNHAELLRSREWGRLAYWDLLDRTEDKAVYQLSDGGYWFAFKGHKIQQTALVRDNEVLDFTGKLVGIEQCIKKKFDINDLYNAQPPAIGGIQ